MLRTKRTYFTLQILLILLCVLFLAWNPVQCRKYNIEYEAVKLYGEDLRLVLKRFRRTPEYMNILHDKVQEMNDDFDNMLAQITFAYEQKMTKYIQLSIAKKQNETRENIDHNDQPKTSPSFRVLEPAPRGWRRQGRQGEETNITTTPATAVEVLEEMTPSNNLLSVTERNQYKDLGFKYAGYAVHDLIKNMGTDKGGEGWKPMEPSEITTTEGPDLHPGGHSPHDHHPGGSERHGDRKEETPAPGKLRKGKTTKM